jgi:hypothetical protein
MTWGVRLGAVVIGGLLLGGPAPQAADQTVSQAKITRAVERGVAYLKRVQANAGTWSYPQKGITTGPAAQADVGATALAALALLECGVPANDPVVQKAAAALRPQTVKLTYTYSLSLAVMFFDRLGDPGDVALIESMAVRLLAGQQRDGGWRYVCPAIGVAEMRRLTEHIRQRSELVTRTKLPRTARKRRTEADLPREIVAQLIQVHRQGPPQIVASDNSNTQFATLALWITRRHGLPVERALVRAAAAYRSTQAPRGGWPYQRYVDLQSIASSAPTATMTCAGLLGLAVGSGSVNEKALQKDPKKKNPLDPNKDPDVRKAMGALAACIGEPSAKTGRPAPVLGQAMQRGYYFLWSVERVAMAYGL